MRLEAPPKCLGSYQDPEVGEAGMMILSGYGSLQNSQQRIQTVLVLAMLTASQRQFTFLP